MAAGTFNTGILNADTINNAAGSGAPNFPFGFTTSGGTQTFSGNSLFASGTAAAPSIAWSADSDGSGTGFYRPTANAIGFAINGVEAAQLDPTRNFGLGTSSPTIQGGTSRELTISNSNNSQLNFQITPATTGVDLGNIAFFNGTTRTVIIRAADAGTTDSGILRFFTKPAAGSIAERLTISSDGIVGINAGSPTSLGTNITTLQVSGGSGDNTRSGGLKLQSNNGSLVASMHFISSELKQGTVSNHPLYFVTNDVERVRIDTTGNVVQTSSNYTIGTDAAEALISQGGDTQRIRFRGGSGGSSASFSIYGSTAGTPSIAEWNANTFNVQFNGTQRFFISSGSSTVIGTQAVLSTSATDGFLYISATAGTPTGTPSPFTGTNPLVYDTTHKHLWIRDLTAPAWRSAFNAYAARRNSNSVASITGTDAVLDFNITGGNTFDDESRITGTGATWAYTAAIAGKYQMSVSALTSAGTNAVNTNCKISVYKDTGSGFTLDHIVAEFVMSTTNAVSLLVHGTSTISMNVGDKIQFQISQSTGNAFTLTGTQNNNWVNISRIGD